MLSCISCGSEKQGTCIVDLKSYKNVKSDHLLNVVALNDWSTGFSTHCMVHGLITPANLLAEGCNVASWIHTTWVYSASRVATSTKGSLLVILTRQDSP